MTERFSRGAWQQSSLPSGVRTFLELMPHVIRHLYVHVPFCAKICPYCSFYVHGGSAGQQKAFVAALGAELRQAAEVYDLSELMSIYLGGGTPSMLNAQLFGDIAAALPRTPAVQEFTLEVNPATVTEAKAMAWAEAGVNRISLGAQSFDADYLQLLGRQHQPEDIPETMAALHTHGFHNLNIDLMFALPSQPEAIWRETLEAAVACEPQHLSAYALTYEEDTPFFEKLQRGEWSLGEVDEEREIAMFTWTRKRLERAGLPAYEISNFAAPGYESLHNQAYWAGRDYLGLGPGAWSTVDGQRWRNRPNTEAYVELIQAGNFTALRTEEEQLDRATKLKERIMFGLRTRQGVDYRLIERLGPYALDAARESVAQELALVYERHLVLTERGQLVADSVAEMFA